MPRVRQDSGKALPDNLRLGTPITWPHIWKSFLRSVKFATGNANLDLESFERCNSLLIIYIKFFGD